MPDEISDRAQETLRKIGNFNPTVHAKDREVKGYGEWGGVDPGKVYLSSADLRVVAEDLTEVADWLDSRAKP